MLSLSVLDKVLAVLEDPQLLGVEVPSHLAKGGTLLQPEEKMLIKNSNPMFYFNVTGRNLLADHIFCIPMSNCLIADTEVPENAHKAYRVKFLLNEMIMS